MFSDKIRFIMSATLESPKNIIKTIYKKLFPPSVGNFYSLRLSREELRNANISFSQYHDDFMEK